MKVCWECGEQLQVINNKVYHYKESGLDNVYLHGIVQYKCPKCGQGGPEIPKIEELHLLIGRELVCKENLLSGAEMKFLRKEIGLKSKEMAGLLDVKPETYSRWENDKDKIGPIYDRHLRSLYMLNADYEFGAVLHEGIRFTKRMALKKDEMAPKKDKIEISASEWLKPFDEPIFNETCLMCSMST
ncbi:MAG TPA: helix-turn-helix domain-containing protein [Syntrophales bacterium]|nr:helix-turn-helix domain-containing protein [Syntrophales bacterium]